MTNYSGQNLTGHNFTGKDLFDDNFSNAILKNAKFNEANLDYANLSGATLTNASFENAYLVGADLEGVSATGVDMTNANLTGADLTGASLVNARLIAANLTGANVTNVDLSGANLFGAILNGVDLTTVKFSSTTNFTDVSLLDAKLPFANLAAAEAANPTIANALDLNTVIFVLPCFRRGTRILTDNGPVRIEQLKVGDVLVTQGGGRRPVIWLGRSLVNCARHRDPPGVWPVKVSAGTFGAGAPSRDLWLSPGHSLAIDGILTPVISLVNGHTITQIKSKNVEYWHVELDAHDVILAEGLPAESYLDTGNRTSFANGGDFVEAFPEFEPRHWMETCLPLRQSGPEVVKIKRQLIEQIEAQGVRVSREAHARVLADGREVEPLPLGPLSFAFVISEPAQRVRLVSRTFVPAHVLPESGDRRTLGLCVAKIQVNGEPLDICDDTLWSEGWNAPEDAGDGTPQRWTTGELPLPSDSRLVVVKLSSEGFYWEEEPSERLQLRALAS